ncbi:MAG: hypothetical protein J6E42_05150, partial [Firmicutes bacterium]|nr:hypothetical protein [Bacillota bacterium]
VAGTTMAGFRVGGANLDRTEKTLASDGAAESLRRYSALWRRALPELPEGTEETLKRMERLDIEGYEGEERDEELALLRLALLLNGDGERSRLLAKQAKLSRREAAVLTEAARLWDRPLCKEEGQLKRWIYRDGYDAVLRSLALRQARSGTAEGEEAAGDPSLKECQEKRRLVERWRQDGVCVTLDRLAVNGSDLRNRGVAPGKQLGGLLERALFAVMDGRVENEREALLRFLGL